jgi:hypothetical protein
MFQTPLTSKAQEEAYLAEPTAAFRQAAAQEAAFRAERIKTRQAWDDLFSKLSKAENTVDMTKFLTEMDEFLKGINGLPAGVKKLDVVRMCRPKKYDGYKIIPTWTVEVEEAYEALLREFDIKTAPQNVRD